MIFGFPRAAGRVLGLAFVPLLFPGLLLALDLPDGETRGKVWQQCWDQGLAVLVCGPRSLRFRPPLVFSEEQAASLLTTLRGALRDTL